MQNYEAEKKTKTKKPTKSKKHKKQMRVIFIS